MEIRRKLIADYKPDFLSNNFEKLEDSLIREFLHYFWKLLHLKSKYTDWLSQKVRPIINNTKSPIVPYISIDYIKSEKYKLSAISIKNFIMFLKFIRFTKKLNYEIQKFENINYRVIIFRVKDFTDECDFIFNSNDKKYKNTMIKQYLQELQQNIFVEVFNDSYSMKTLIFQSQTKSDRLSGIFRITFYTQSGSNYLLARVIMMDSLFHYQYPFRLSDLFQENLSKHEKLVRGEFYKALSCKYPYKTIDMRQFFDTYKLSNTKAKDFKQSFIDLILTFQQYQLTEENGLLLTTQTSININSLTTSNISDGIILYENFNKNSFLLNNE